MPELPFSLTVHEPNKNYAKGDVFTILLLVKLNNTKNVSIIDNPYQGRNQLFISGGAIFIKFHSMTSLCLFNRGTTFSQTVTYNNNNVFLPADTKSIVYKHTHSVQRWLMKTERFTTALEAESPVSSEISDFTPYAHAQSNILHIKYAEKTDD